MLKIRKSPTLSADGKAPLTSISDCHLASRYAMSGSAVTPKLSAALITSRGTRSRSDGNAWGILGGSGMSRLLQLRRSNRCLVAACLALLFSFGSLAPLAAQSFSSAPAGMACCRTKGKSCCNRNQAHHAPAGPVFAAVSCASDCCPVSLGGIALAGFGIFRTRVWEAALHAAAVLNGRPIFPASAFAFYDLQQRPPPSTATA